VFKTDTPADQAAQATALRGAVKAAGTVAELVAKVSSLHAFMLERSPRYKAACLERPWGASAHQQPARRPSALPPFRPDVGVRVYLHPSAKAAHVNESLAGGRIAPVASSCVRKGVYHICVQREAGASTTFAPFSDLYAPADLALASELADAQLGPLLGGWNVGDAAQYSPITRQAGTRVEAEYATLCPPKAGGVQAQEIAAQLLAVHAKGVVRVGILISGVDWHVGSNKLTCDWSIWASPDPAQTGWFWERWKDVEGAESWGRLLMRLGYHAPDAFAQLRQAEAAKVPHCVADLQQLAEANGASRLAQQPAHLTVTLKGYQRKSLGWMQDEEASAGIHRHLYARLQLPTAAAGGVAGVRRMLYSPLLNELRWQLAWRTCGGILAEPMGSGKTIVALALILADLEERAARAASGAAAPPTGHERGDAQHAQRAASAGVVASSDATLVVVPVSLVGQWESELRARVAPAAKLRVCRWYGDKRERDPAVVASQHDVVITTYETLGMAHNWKEGSEQCGKLEQKRAAKAAKSAAAAAAEAAATAAAPAAAAAAAPSAAAAGAAGASQLAPKSRERSGAKPQRATLEEIRWRRVIFDESQALKDPDAARTAAASALWTQRIWLLSGTPVSTKVDDLRGQLEVLNLWMLSHAPTFRYFFSAPFDANPWFGRRTDAPPAAAILLPRLMLRHSAAELKAGDAAALALPPLTRIVRTLELSVEERALYAQAEAHARERWGELQASGEAGKHYLRATALITPLRRLCSGGGAEASAMVLSMLSADRADAAPQACAVCGLEADQAVRAPCCAAWACYTCLATAALESGRCPSAACGARLTRQSVSPPAAAAAAASAAPPVVVTSKLAALLATLEAARVSDPGARALIFSSFAGSLAWLRLRLTEQGYKTGTVTGEESLEARVRALAAFQEGSSTVLLLSLRTGAVGLNLTAASHVILLEPALNAALEEQAIGRVHRLGQNKRTTVTRLVVRDSVEERLAALVRNRVAGGSLEEALMGEGSSTSLADIGAAIGPYPILARVHDAWGDWRRVEKEGKVVFHNCATGASACDPPHGWPLRR